MAYMRFKGDAAAYLWEHVKLDYDELRRAAEMLDPANPDPRLELDVITLIANIGFGQDDVLKHRGTTRRQYFQELYDINPFIFRVHYSRKRLLLEAEDYGIRIDLGFNVAYSTLMPLSLFGAEAYTNNQLSSFEFTAKHILPPRDVANEPCFIYGEGVFHLGALRHRRHLSPDSEWYRVAKNIGHQDVDEPEKMLPGVFRHLEQFMPTLKIAGKQLVADPPGAMPTIIFADNGGFAQALLKRGFAEPTAFPRLGIAGYPRYVLNLEAFNQLDDGDDRKKGLHHLTKRYHREIDSGPPKRMANQINRVNRTLTIVFLDMDESTPKADRLGPKWTTLLDKYYQIVRRHINSFAGLVRNVVGDGFVISFEDVEAALNCVMAIRNDVRSIGVTVHGGVHHGQVTVARDDVSGREVHRAARIMGECAKADQILVSGVVKSLVDHLKFRFEELGARQLRGLSGETDLYVLVDG